MFLTAEAGHVVAVCDCFAVASDIGLETVLVCGALEVDTEACADVVDDENYAVLVADLANLLPVAFFGKHVVGEVAVHVRRGDEACDLAGVFLAECFELFRMVPVNIEVVDEIFFGDTAISEFLHPRSNAVIVAFGKDDFFAMGVCTSDHDCELSCIAAVLCEERPVCHFDGFAHFFCEVDSDVGNEGGAIAFLSLFCRRRVYVGIVVAEIVGAVCAHPVDDAVAVYVIDICALRVGHIKRIALDGDHTTFGRAKVTVDTCGDDVQRTFEGFLAFCYVYNFFRFVNKIHNNTPYARYSLTTLRSFATCSSISTAPKTAKSPLPIPPKLDASPLRILCANSRQENLMVALGSVKLPLEA